MTGIEHEDSRPFIGAWDFLAALAAITGISTAVIVISKQVEDGRDALALSSIVVMGIVLVFLISTLSKVLKQRPGS